MAEIIYQYPLKTTIHLENSSIHWLDADDFDVFNRHLADCGQRSVNSALWSQIQESGTIYCGLFIGSNMVARACVEKYSDTKWEVADVRTVKAFRNRGFAFQTCNFILQYILAHEKTATIRTEEDNWAMQHVIAKLGFTQVF